MNYLKQPPHNLYFKKNDVSGYTTGYYPLILLRTLQTNHLKTQNHVYTKQKESQTK